MATSSATSSLAGSFIACSIKTQQPGAERSWYSPRSADSQKIKGRRIGDPRFVLLPGYRVDSISKPQASKSGSGMYFEFLLRRAHSRRRVDRRSWSGESLYSRTTCPNSVIVGVIGPIASGLPQLGFPRRLPINYCLSTQGG